MGVVTAARSDSFRSRDTLVSVAATLAGTLSAAAFVALATALIALGWRDFRWVLTAPGGAANALVISLLAIAISLPLTCASAFLAAACSSDATIGGRASWLLRRSLEISAGIPPVVVGTAVFFAVTFLTGRPHLLAVVAALTVLNLPNATARFARVFALGPEGEREAAIAAGASPVSAFFGVVAPRSLHGLWAAFFYLAAQMSGETSAVVVAGAGGPQPLSSFIWHFASNPNLVRTQAASCLLLVLLVSALMLLARAWRPHSAKDSETIS